ncbi:zeta toxin family protein [Nemorincola caseinilytica]|uniref:Zeta toxin family protein n=1 Tax=Nemorincola caseinilytica TaxID=2054315 RepID=A0ABP8NPG2_9BACT
MADLYIIAGCNGAGKTTASFTVFPDVLGCREFVNADNIAAGISPFNPESVAIEAGRIMLHRIDELLETGVDFAIETTLATRSYVGLVHRAHRMGYTVTLIYIWLTTPELALQRVAERVQKGGHNIPGNVVRRRYYKGAHNLFHLFMPICDTWIVADNSYGILEPIARKESEFENIIENPDLWSALKKLS